MKYIVSFICLVAIGCALAFSGFKVQDNAPAETEYLRIHIRANSNSDEDQKVKYMVRDAVVEAMIPLLSEVETKPEAEKKMRENFSYIENVANEVLKKQGFNYCSNAYLSNEYFPTRTYENLTLESGYYDSLILALGSGQGDNWWCVVYPAFCFLETKNSSNSVYISKIWEIINGVKNK